MKLKVTYFPVILTLVGCQQNNSQLSLLTSELDALKAKVVVLEAQSILSQADQSVTLDTSSGSYRLVQTNVGPLLVAFKDAKPYLNGQKLTLNLGNPLLTTYSGAKIKLIWGKTPEFGKPGFDFAEWKKTTQEKTLTITNTLSAGSWNPVEVVLVPATPEQLEYLEIAVTLDQLSLRP